MDEPFSGLDPVTLGEVIKLLNEVANMDELNTVMVVTHDIHSALVVADTMFTLGRNRSADERIVSGACVQCCYRPGGRRAGLAPRHRARAEIPRGRARGQGALPRAVG